MEELLNVGFTYSCRTYFSNKEGKSPIVLRIAFRGERRDNLLISHGSHLRMWKLPFLFPVILLLFPFAVKELELMVGHYEQDIY